ncbi:MAG: phage tail protein [Oscillospiraceae bacterium]|nr:phage tail protein [Oscillospiraceae bacterium]
MSSRNKPRVYDQSNNLLCVLDKATDIGYTQVYNNIWTARFKLPEADAKNKFCEPFNYVEIFEDGKRVELFRIIKDAVTKDENNLAVIEYECEHVITTLLDDPLFKFHQIGNIGVFTREVMEYILNHQTERRWVLGACEFSHQFLYKWESDNLLAALFSVPRPFMDDWHFIYDTTVYPWVVNLVRASHQVDCEVRYKKNMRGIERQRDSTNLVTRLIPLGYGEGDNQLTIASVNNGRNFIDADTIGIWGQKTAIWTDRRFENAENMLATGQAMLERLKNPWLCYTVSAIDLFKYTRQDFDKLAEGRMVRVVDNSLGINVDTRIIEIDKPDVTKANVTVVIENHDRNVAGSLSALAERARINDTHAQGHESLLAIPFIDNAQPEFPALFDFFIPANLVNINQAIMRIQLLPFRANSRAVRGGGGITQSTTNGGGTTQSTTNGGGTTQSTTNGGGTTQTSTADGAASPQATSGPSSATSASSAHALATIMSALGAVNTLYTSGTGSHRHGIASTSLNHTHTVITEPHTHGIAHTHTVTVSIPNHSHNLTIPAHSHNVTIPAHSHSVTIPAHSHSVTIPNHVHDIEFGIVQGGRASSISIRVDGTLIPVQSNLNEVDIAPFLRRDGSGRIVRGVWHRLEIVPNQLTRISAHVFLRIFTNSRGGHNL